MPAYALLNPLSARMVAVTASPPALFPSSIHKRAWKQLAHNYLIVSYNVALDTHRCIPNAHIVAIPGGTHLIVATHGQEIGKAVERFIS